VPAVTPVTTPALLTVAIAAALLLQVPPLTAWPRASVEPAHTGELPVIAAGATLTVIVLLTLQPLTA